MGLQTAGVSQTRAKRHSHTRRGTGGVGPVTAARKNHKDADADTHTNECDKRRGKKNTDGEMRLCNGMEGRDT